MHEGEPGRVGTVLAHKNWPQISKVYVYVPRWIVDEGIGERTKRGGAGEGRSGVGRRVTFPLGLTLAKGLAVSLI